MANWISSKLKVAETFFEQIDQQAAESLKKNERPRSDEYGLGSVPAKSGGTVPLKDQLKKKTRGTDSSVEYLGKLSSDPNANVFVNNDGENENNKAKNVGRSGSGGNNGNGGKEVLDFPRSSPKPKPTLTDSDWTELLGSANQGAGVSSPQSIGISGIRSLRKVGSGRKGGSVSNLFAGDGKSRVSKGGDKNGEDFKSKKRLDVVLGGKVNWKPSDGEESGSSARSSSVDMLSDDKVLGRQDSESKDVDGGLVERENSHGSGESAGQFVSVGISHETLLQEENEALPLVKVSLKKNEGAPDVKQVASDVYDSFGSNVTGKHGSGAALRSSVSDDLTRDSSLTSDSESDSDSDSGSSSDSENERDRERRKKILVEKAAAKAVEAIKERENMVARLEGEKLSLEKILEERAKQQVQEASELQTTMIETMEAVELEKQKHNTTRMEALARLAKLETANADLAKSLAAAQKNLEVEINQAAELRQLSELKDSTIQDLRRRISESHQTGTSLNQIGASKGYEIEKQILEAEFSFLTDKILILEEKARKLEENVEMTRKEMEEPTEVEIELKQRLHQLTDHLIQKQAQVEALSSEKATVLLRIEAVSRLLDENKPMMNSKDLESGAWEIADSKLRPLLEDKLRSGRKHLGSLVEQLDSIFTAGSVFIKRNSTARLWSVVYLVILHFWVIYILTSHSQPSMKGKSGAVFS